MQPADPGEGRPFERLAFENRFVDELPGEDDLGNHTRHVNGVCYSRVTPTRVPAPRLLAHAGEVATLLGFDDALVKSPDFVDVMAGNRVLPGMKPYAACYGGHQFGNWAGQLGDGRAITLGERVGVDGRRWELQLKGAGRTPYSRNGDGRAVLRSSVREFLCSEAMHHLGVPTTRALCLVATGEDVVRDMFYDGHPRREPGAIVCRVAPTFLRFGNFEILAARRDEERLRALAEHTMRTHFPTLGPPGPERYAAMLAEVCRSTALMIDHWMRVGFVHGVMNTDNMSVLGLTIDYGPYGWLDVFDPDWTPNTTDAGGRRYRFGHQPQVALWNLVRFAESLLPLVGEVAPLEQALRVYDETLRQAQESTMARKLGFAELREEDTPLVESLFRVLQRAQTDMTIFFRSLADVDCEDPAAVPDRALMKPLMSAYYDADALTEEQAHDIAEWLRRYLDRRGAERAPRELRRQRMNAANPRFVMRNYLAQQAIDLAEAGEVGEIERLLDVMRRPYDEQPGREAYAGRRPDWARDRAGCSMLSCSS